jgi:predicted ATP-dependent serine protease
MLKKSFASVHSTGYPSLRIGRQALVALYGPPGGGKSTFLFKFLDGVEGEVLYLSLEEGLSDTVVDRLRRLEVCRGDFRIGYARTVDEIADLVNKHRPNAIGLDSLSITTLTVDDLMRLSSCVGVPVLFSLHTTKDGLPAGSMTTLHAADVVLRVGGMRWAVEKSRFTGPLEGEV